MSLLVVLLVLVTVAILAEGFLRAATSERRIRRAGIGADRPGCPTCLYPLGGWSGPNCPECATDVTERGVCAGSDAHRRRRLAIASVLSLWIGLPAFGLVAGVLVDAGDVRVETYAHSLADDDLHVVFAVERAWSRIPPRLRRTVTVDLFDTVAATGQLSFVNGRPAGMTGLRSTRITVAGPPPEGAADAQEQVRRRLDELTGGRLSPEQCQTHAASIAAAIDAGLRAGGGSGRAALPMRAPLADSGGWSSRTVGPGPWRQLIAVVGTLVALVGLLLIVGRIVRRRTSGGIRPPAPEEWTTARRE